jgi:hypothetical protein
VLFDEIYNDSDNRNRPKLVIVLVKSRMDGIFIWGFHHEVMMADWSLSCIAVNTR